MTSGPQNILVSNGTVDREFTVSNSDGIPITNENMVNVQTLHRCSNERIDKEMGNIADTFEERVQNAILTAIDKIINPLIELAIKSINASSGQDTASVIANSEDGERIGITAPFRNVSEENNTFHE